MNTDFSIRRIGLLFRKDWIEYRKKAMFNALIIIGIFAICLLWPASEQRVFNPFPFYFLGLIGTAIGYFRYVGQAIHQPKGLFLTLPASTPEKFVVFLIEGLAIFVVFQGLFWAGIGIGSWFMPIKQTDMMNVWVEIRGLSVILFLSSILFFSYVTFRKFAFGIAVGIYFSMLVALVGIAYQLRDIAFSRNGEGNFSLIAEPWMPHLVAPLFLLLTLGVLYLAYNRLKRKELR